MTYLLVSRQNARNFSRRYTKKKGVVLDNALCLQYLL